MNIYIKSVSQKCPGEDREKILPVDLMAQAMISHGEEFESDSVFGSCLISTFPFGQKCPGYIVNCYTSANP